MILSSASPAHAANKKANPMMETCIFVTQDRGLPCKSDGTAVYLSIGVTHTINGAGSIWLNRELSAGIKARWIWQQVPKRILLGMEHRLQQG